MADQILYYGSSATPDTGVNKTGIGGSIPSAVVDYITANACGAGTVFQAALTLASLPVTVTATSTAVGFGGTKIFTFPQAHIISLGATATLTTAEDSANLVDVLTATVGIGSAVANDVDMTDATDDDFATSDTASAGAVKLVSAGFKAFNGTVTAPAAWLNVTVPADKITDDTSGDVLVSGKIYINWIYSGV